MVTASGLKSNFKILSLLSVITAVFIAVGYTVGGQLGMIIGLGFAGVFNLGSYWFSDRIVLKMYKAEELPEEDYPELHKMLERLSENAGIPKPRLYKNGMQVPNAFATGRSPKKGVVCLTEGLMDQLTQEEIEGVVAHELAHIKNRDSLVNAVVATIAGAVAVIAEMAFWSSMFSGNRDRGEMMSAMAFMILVPLISLVIRTAVSRTMEYRADSDAVRIHGKKEGLSSALNKISSANKNTGGQKQHNSRIQEAGANLFIENPFSSDKMTKYFSTHPPLESRLENIEKTDMY